MKKLSKKQFVTVVENIHNTVNYSFDSKHCEAFGVLIDKDLNVQIEKIDSSTDIYDMLDTDNDNLLNQINKYDMVSFATNGWAAPIAKDNDDEYSDVAPSQHPERRRVKMVIFSDKFGQQMSAISFRNENDEYVLDDYLFDDSGTGSLSNAIKALYI